MKNPCGWRIIPQGEITVDCSKCRYTNEIHNQLKSSFGFPDNYGANWSAFWDYLDDFCGDRESETTIIVPGLNQLDKEMRDYSQKMVEIMHRAEKEYPLVHFIFRDS